MNRTAAASLMLVVSLTGMAIGSLLMTLGVREVTDPPSLLRVGTSIHTGAVLLLVAGLVVIGTKGKREEE